MRLRLWHFVRRGPVIAFLQAKSTSQSRSNAMSTLTLLSQVSVESMFGLAGLALFGLVLVLALPLLIGVRYIPNNRIGVIEKLWSSRGSIASGQLMALNGEAGYQAEVLRGGLHFKLGFSP